MNDLESLKSDEQLLVMLEEMQDQIENLEMSLKKQKESNFEAQEKISEIFSENLILRNEMQKKSEIIISLNDKIGKLSESDKVLKENNLLRKQNKVLKESEQKTKLEAVAMISVANDDYRKRVEELSFREDELSKREMLVVKREEDVRGLRNSIQTEIEIHSNHKVQNTITNLNKQMKEKQYHLQKEYKLMKAGYKSVFVGVLLYGIVTTIFEAIKAEVLRQDVVEFFIALSKGMVNGVLGLWLVGGYIAKYGDMIPQPSVAVVVRWILQVMVTGTFSVVITALIYKVSKLLVKYAGDKLKDEISLTVLLGVMAVFVFFSESICSMISINLFFVYLLVVTTYLIIRCVVEMEDSQERKALLVNVVCGLLIIFALWIVVKMMTNGLSGFTR